MQVINELKLNKFQRVVIPKTSELFNRFGRTGVPSDKAYTGDVLADFGMRKTEQLEQSMRDYKEYERQMANSSNNNE